MDHLDLIDVEDLDAIDVDLQEWDKFLSAEDGVIVGFVNEKASNAKVVNLTNTGLTQLDASTLHQMPNLQSLNLSYNLLTSFPEVSLPHMKHLNLEGNSIRNFSFLQNMASLEELNIRGNCYESWLPYWIVAKLKKLRSFNGENVNSIRHYLSLAEFEMNQHVDNIWESRLSEMLKSIKFNVLHIKKDFSQSVINECGIIGEAAKALENNAEQYVINKLKQELDQMLKCFETPVTTANIEIAATADLDDYDPLMDTNNDDDDDDASIDILSAAFSKEVGDFSFEPQVTSTPVANHFHSDHQNILPLQPSLNLSSTSISSCDSSSLASSPASSFASSPASSPASSFASSCDLNSTLIINKFNNSTNSSSFNLSLNQSKSTSLSKRNDENCATPTSNYTPLKVLLIHSRDGDVNDRRTQVWDIKFKPKTRQTRNEIVATCGGPIVNIIDIKTQSVIKRFQDNDMNEVFQCLEWSIFRLNKSKNGSSKDLVILAVGGIKNQILILNSQNMNDCIKFKAHKKSVNCLEFDAHKKNHLYSGSYDKKIILWKFDWSKNSIVSKTAPIKLLEIEANARLLSLVYSSMHDVLVASSEDGLLLYAPNSHSKSGHLRSVALDDGRQLLVDGLSLIEEKPHLIAFRHRNHIIVSNLSLMVNYAKDYLYGQVPAFIVVKLKYSDLSCDYFYLSIKSRLLACGDAGGNIWTYLLDDSVLNSTKSSTTFNEPTEIIKWPKLTANEPFVDANKDIFVNVCAVGHNQNYIIAGTNNNMVCIWQRIFRVPELLR